MKNITKYTRIRSRITKITISAVALILVSTVTTAALYVVRPIKEDGSNAAIALGGRSGGVIAGQSAGGQATTTNSSKDAPKQDQAKQASEAAQKAAESTSTTQPSAPKPAAAAKVTVAVPSPRGLRLYVNTSLLAGRPAQIANQPVATWLGEWSGSVRSAANTVVSAATAQGTVPTLVAYNIPSRDCGSYSAGGSNSSEGYRAWIRDMAAGIGNRKAIVILEPDALAQVDCLPASAQGTRIADLAYAVDTLASQTKAFIYLDAGHSAWVDAGTMADRLKKANVGKARGFALNVSNYQTTPNNTAYGNKIAAATAKTFVIDTSRNGKGPNGEWCNPRGRGLGARPTTNVSGNIDAYLWVKVPGESDGECNGGPSAGTFWAEYANELITNS